MSPNPVSGLTIRGGQTTSCMSLSINVRPDINNMLLVNECMKYFSDFSKNAFIHESVACIMAIQKYMTFITNNKNEHALHCQKFNEIVDCYIDEKSSKETVNLSGVVRSNVMKYRNVSMDVYIDMLESIVHAINDVKEELKLILSFRIPHFTQSNYWYDFVNKHPDLVKKCITEIDLEKWSKVRYGKRDFSKDILTPKEDLLCELLREDNNLFRLQKTDTEGSLAVYLLDGKDILDEKDINMGKFQGFKVAGTLPYPPWLVMLAVSSIKFHSNVWKGCKFDAEYDFHYIPAQYNEEGNITNYDTHICKLIMDYGKMLDYRSCYVITSNMYKNNRTYLITKSVTPLGDKYKSNVLLDKLYHDNGPEIRDPYHTNDIFINMKGRKKCVYVPNLSLFAVEPMGDNQCTFSFVNLLNPGGLLLSKIGTPEKRMMAIAETYRSSMITEINRILSNNKILLTSMGSVYDMVRTKLNMYKKASKSKNDHIFNKNFSEALETMQ